MPQYVALTLHLFRDGRRWWKNYAAAGLVNINSSNLIITVTYPDSGLNSPGSRVLVTVTYVYAPMIGYFNRLLNTQLGSNSEGVITY